ncbi:hypothetical protein E1B28_008799 [Marasmius oreades]|uniref:Uncharacterized protein n=1 Tax=Marasmius oreades TaxID=181124 RepID=A0A9P7RZ99_9AGAR|nr:uncharacterized protein E1B28_008799 [Marasmius oreades]KAG7092445.1 hypothetical protein E1B28_008799 [Marasmius oreades]
MAEQTRIHGLLKLCIETCNAALDSISDDQLKTDDNSDPQQSLTVVHKDLISLLSFIYVSTTKLALVLNPSSPTYPAAVTPINDLAKHISALSHCVRLFSPIEHGATITQEAVNLVTNVVAAVKVLLQTFLETGHSAAREYMMKTGTVHDMIEGVRSSNGLSKDNLSAVRKKWHEDGGPLDDGARELRELIDNAGDASEDYGWKELGLEPDAPFSEQEADRASKIHMILRLTALLHRKVYTDLLKTSPENPPPSHLVLDKLPSLSRALVSAADEVIAASHPPQDPSMLRLDLNVYKGVLKDIEDTVHLFFSKDSVEVLIEGLSLHDGELGKKKKISKLKWFDGCFEQIEKGFRTAEASISESEA